VRDAWDGPAARLYHLMKEAAALMELRWIWIRSPGNSWTSAADVPDPSYILDAPPAPWMENSNRGRLLRLGQYSFDRLPFGCYPRKWPRLREALRDARPDVAVFYLPYLAHLVDHAPPTIPVVAALDEGWEEVYREWLRGSTWKTAWLARREVTRYARVYRRVNRRASAVIAISAEERERFAKNIRRDKIVVVPHGVDTGYFCSRERKQRDVDVLVVGDLRAARNYLGVLAALEAAKALPECRHWVWMVVGRIDEDVRCELEKQGAVVTGTVDDVRPYYERARAVLVPAVAGSGTKTTSIQAWAMGRPLVASVVGARGLPARQSQNMLIADDAAGLVSHLTAVLTQPALADRLAREGRQTAERECDMSALGGRFADVCVEIAASGVARDRAAA
jgi:glycosyltransferase involved in cell wall biosynthesis